MGMRVIKRMSKTQDQDSIQSNPITVLYRPLLSGAVKSK